MRHVGVGDDRGHRRPDRPLHGIVHEAAQRQDPDEGEDQDGRRGEARVPVPPDAPGRLAPRSTPACRAAAEARRPPRWPPRDARPTPSGRCSRKTSGAAEGERQDQHRVPRRRDVDVHDPLHVAHVGLARARRGPRSVPREQREPSAHDARTGHGPCRVDAAASVLDDAAEEQPAERPVYRVEGHEQQCPGAASGPSDRRG